MANFSVIKSLHVKLLIIEDDDLVCKNIQDYCASSFSKIFTASSGNEAMKIYLEEKPDVILTDIELPGVSGIDFISEIRKVDFKTLVFMISAYPKEEYLLKAISLKLEDFIIKPLSSFKMDSFLDKCFEKLYLKEAFFSPCGKWKYSFTNKCLLFDEGYISLTHFEILIFEILLQYKNTYVLYENMENALYYDVELSKSSLRTIISRIRKKAPFLEISSKQNVGYCLHVNY